MPVVKIIAKGFESYNGVLEGVQFENGVSVEPLSQFAAERIGAFMKIVDADNPDVPLGLGYRMANARISATQPREALQKIVRTKTGKEKTTVKAAPTINYDFTRADLEKVADEGGIQSLRKVAEQYDVRGRAINEIIDSMMAKKANAEAKKAAQPPAKADTLPPVEPEISESSDIDSLIEG